MKRIFSLPFGRATDLLFSMGSDFCLIKHKLKAREMCVWVHVYNYTTTSHIEK